MPDPNAAIGPRDRKGNEAGESSGTGTAGEEAFPPDEYSDPGEDGDIAGVVREVHVGVVEQSTLDGIEQFVCDRLAASDSYEFAWIGGADPDRNAVRVRARAGDGDRPPSIETPDDRRARPTDRAFDTGEMQVTRDLHASDSGSLREWANEYGFRAAAAIPISHEGVLYRVLTLYTGRAGAFDDGERDLLAQLGTVVGHAIAATERKRALADDEMVEVEFRVRDVLDGMELPASDGTVEVERSIPVGDGEFVQYGVATPDMIGVLEAFTERLPAWEDVEYFDESSTAVRFGARLSEPPLGVLVASKGARVRRSAIEDGDHHLVVSLPHDGVVREVVEAVEDEYPAAEFVSKRQVSDPETPPRRGRGALFDDLTERQRTVLESAYSAGFFEWPRASTGEEIAETLDIAPSTFHQHLRKAEETVVGGLLDDSIGGDRTTR